MKKPGEWYRLEEDKLKKRILLYKMSSYNRKNGNRHYKIRSL
jgi:hypothetical protein